MSTAAAAGAASWCFGCLPSCSEVTSCIACGVCSSLCSACGSRKDGRVNHTVVRVCYALVFFLSSIVAWIMLDKDVAKSLSDMSKFTHNLCKGDDEDACWRQWGLLGVCRIMFASSLFSLVLALAMLGVKSNADRRAPLQNSYWIAKLVLVAALTATAFFIPNDFFLAWNWIALVGAFLFMLVQVVLIIDFACGWAEGWIEEMEGGSKCHLYGMILSVVTMYGLTVTGIVLLFVNYARAHDGNTDAHCIATNQFVISMCLVLCIAMTVLSFLPAVRRFIPSSGPIQSGCIGLYITWLTFSALSNAPGECKPQGPQDDSDAFDPAMIPGALITFISIGYSSLRIAAKSNIGQLGLADGAEYEATCDDDDDAGEGTALLSPKATDSEAAEAARINSGGGVSDPNTLTYKWSFFHFVFCFAAMYMLCVIVGWQVLSKDGNAKAHTTFGNTQSAMWVQIVASWLCAFLYIWTLVAPICLPNRDFTLPAKK